MNSYSLVNLRTTTSAIVDPGAEPEKILELVQGTQVTHILITHGHADHVGTLEEIRRVTSAPVHIHPHDAAKFSLKYDLPLVDGQELDIDGETLRVWHAPGHTPGMCCFDLGDGRVLVGDTVFVGGPGKTWSAQDFTTQMQTMRAIVFAWPDNTVFFPGHGSAGRIGAERVAFEAFLQRGWPEDLFGDVTWAT